MTKPVPKRWSQRTAIKIGAALGVALLIWRVIEGTAASATQGTAGLVGYGIGSIIGAVFLSCLVVGVRNFVIFGRRKEAE